MRRFFRITYYLGGILLFVLIALIGYTQTRSFKSYLRNTILEESQNALSGNLYIGEISGNLITGFEIDSVIVADLVTELLSAERVEIKYDIFGFLFKRAAISNAVIIKPRIHLFRSVDGTWNVARLIRLGRGDSTQPAWGISIKGAKLVDAEVICTDSLRLSQRERGKREESPDGVIDYARIHLTGFSIEVSAEILDSTYAASIKDLRFISHKPAFTLRHFKGDFLLTKDKVSAKNMRIQTAGSDLKIDTELDKVDIVNLSRIEELQTKPLDLTLTAEGIDTRELKQFLYPWVDFLDKKIKLQLRVDGAFGRFNIRKLLVQLPQSSVQLQGEFRNLHHPVDLEMTVGGNNNWVSPQDLIDCLPGLHLPDLNFIGPLTFSLTYDGRPTDYKARVTGSSPAGGFDVDGAMKIEEKHILYSGTAELRSLALGTLLQNDKMTSDLNAKITIDGANFNPRIMTGLVKIEIDSSRFNQMPVRRSVFVFDIADGLLRSHIAASMGIGTYEVSSSVKFFPKDSLQYSFNCRINSLDLAELLQDRRYESDLSFTLAASGSIGAAIRADTAEMRFIRSVFGLKKFDDAAARLTFNFLDSANQVLRIRSTPADVDVEGYFGPLSLMNACENSYRLVAGAISHRFKNLDSLRSISGLVLKVPAYIVPPLPDLKSIDAKIDVNVKDFEPIGIFTHTPLTGQGSLEGAIIGDPNELQFSGKLHLERFGLRSGTDTLAADTASFEYFFGGINRQTILKTLNASVDAQLRNLNVNSLIFNDLNSRVIMEPDIYTFQASTLIDSTARIDIKGTSKVSAGLMEIIVPEIKTDIGKYIAENSDTVRLILGRDGFFVRSLTMVHETEKAVLSGFFSPGGKSNLTILLNEFMLSNLKQILHRGPYGKSSTQFGGIVNANTSFRGSFSRPEIMIEIQADGVKADDILQNKHKVLGRVDSRISYMDHLLSLLVKFASRPDDSSAAPDLLISGILPYDFSLAQEQTHKLEGEVDLTLKSTGLNLEFIDPFIPEVSRLSGLMTCDMKMKGPIEAPHYEGSMLLRNAYFVFDPLGIPYILNGDFVPVGDHIRLEHFTVRNDPEEPLHVGIMQVSGSFTLLGLQLKEFDLLMQGDLKIMSEENRLKGQKIYGNLFIATGSDGLTWRGDLAASTVAGAIFVKDAQLILPPEKEAELRRASVVNLTFKNDTLHVDTLKNGVIAYNEQKKNTSSNNRESMDENSLTSGSQPRRGSFLDRISYDLSLETQGPTQLRFVFNTQTSEELFADLQGRLSFNKTPDQSRLTGQVDVSNRSYYNFIKKFEAEGNLFFTGDILNPELDVTATYEGTHRALNAPPAPTDSVKQSTNGSTTSESAADEQVLVTLRITGTRNEPKTKISLQTKTFNEKDWVKWEEKPGRVDEEANAISYIISGQFRDELTDQQRMGLIGTNVGFALASSMLTGPLSEAARKATYGVVQSVDMLYYGGQFGEAADLRVTGKYQEVIFRAGGRVFTGDIGNTNVSVELPMSYVVGVDGLRNLILTLERRVEAIQSTEEQRRASNGARLFYRITF